MIDADRQVDESPSEDNNFIAKRIAVDRTPVPPPDLVTESVFAPTDAFDRNSVTVRWKVANRGAGPTDPGAWSDSVWLTQGKGRPSANRGDIFLGNVAHTGVLAVGENYEARGTFSIPAGVQGAWFVTVFSDSNNAVYEEAFASNINPDAPNDLDGSNLRSIPMNVLLSPPADLVVSNITAPATGKGGSQMTVRWTVTNRGAVVTDRDRWADAVYLSNDDKFDSSDKLVFAIPHVGVLQPDQSYTQEATFTLPPSATGSHLVVSTNVNPNIAADIADPDLLSEVKAILQRLETAIGKPLADVSLADLKQFDRETLLSILAGPTQEIATVYEGPFTSNNSAAVASNVVDLDNDLVIQNVQSNSAADSGERIRVTWQVGNLGSDPTWPKTRFQYFVYVSKDPTFIESRASYVGTLIDSGETIAPNETRSLSLDVNLPRGIEGRWYAHVIGNAFLTRYGLSLGGWSPAEFPSWPSYFSNRIWERNIPSEHPRIFNNRSSSPAIEVTYREADLKITDFTVTPPTPESSGQAIARWTVTNAGNRTTGQTRWSDGLYLSLDNTLATSDLSLAQIAQNRTLDPGQSYSVEAPFDIPDNIGGPFRFILFADSPFSVSYGEALGWNPPYPENADRISGGGSGGVPEFRDEGNNTATVETTIIAVERPNLRVTQVTSDERVLVGRDFRVHYSLQNNGDSFHLVKYPGSIKFIYRGIAFSIRIATSILAKSNNAWRLHLELRSMSNSVFDSPEVCLGHTTLLFVPTLSVAFQSLEGMCAKRTRMTTTG